MLSHGSKPYIKFSWEILSDIFLALMELATDIYDDCNGSIIELVTNISSWAISWTVWLTKIAIGLWLLVIALKLLGFNP